MSQKSFYKAAGIVLLLAAILHALRILNNWSVTVETYPIPMWVSWILVVIAGWLAYQGLRGR